LAPACRVLRGRTAAFTYDTENAAVLRDLRGWSVYQGSLIEDQVIEAGAHTLSLDPAPPFPTQIWVGDNHPEVQGRDGFGSGAEMLMNSPSSKAPSERRRSLPFRPTRSPV
jgi:hypothetical protein